MALTEFRDIILPLLFREFAQVVLDWLHSELAAVPFVLRFLKMLIMQQKDVDEQQYSSFSCLQYVFSYHFLNGSNRLISVQHHIVDSQSQ